MKRRMPMGSTHGIYIEHGSDYAEPVEDENRKKATLIAFGKTYEVDIVKEVYVNKSLALRVYDSEGMFATLSVNLPGSGALPQDQCYFKNYTENEGFLEQLEEQGLIKRLGQEARSGFVSLPLVEVLF